MVCASNRLAALDRSMSAMYYEALSDADGRTRSTLRRSRDRFLAVRERGYIATEWTRSTVSLHKSDIGLLLARQQKGRAGRSAEIPAAHGREICSYLGAPTFGWLALTFGWLARAFGWRFSL